MSHVKRVLRRHSFIRAFDTGREWAPTNCRNPVTWGRLRLSWSVSGDRAQRRLAIFVIGLAVIAAGLVIWSVPATVAVLPHVPSGFWALVVLALVVDFPVFSLTRRSRQLPRTTLSVCFTFALLLVGRNQPAIVVQALAGAVTAVGQRMTLREGVFLTSRLVCALAAAAAVDVLVVHHPVTSPGTGFTGRDIESFVLPGAAWFIVSYGVLALARALLKRAGVPGALPSVREDLLGTTVFILLVSPLLTTMVGWWRAVIVIPLIAWNQLRRERVQQEQQLIREPISGVLNRRGLSANVEALISTDMLGQGRPRPFGILVVNVESVLEINRRLGRDVYEDVTAVVAARLAKAFGADGVARVSGEGFVVLAPGLDEPGAVEEGNRTVGVLAPPIVVDSIPFALDPVVGIALSPEHGFDLGTLIAKAEVASLEARRMGEPARLYVRAAAALLQHRVSLLTELQTALHDPARADEVAVLYQPQVDLRTGQLTGVEALFRWTHPEWGPVGTEDLIAAVEPTEVMHALTERVVNTVMRQLQDWNARGFHVRAAVNVSVGDLHDPRFPSRLDTALRNHAVHPSQFVVEITEGMLISDESRVGKAADAISGLGIGLSLDDFGTGYASLQSLREFPLTEVKIDRSYVREMAADATQRALVVGIHHLARSLSLAVVAEGVEDDATAQLLARLPGTIGQGWHFGKAMPAHELETWSRKRHAA
jgi:diguanylate cyclase (GGDEF)-like protein